MVEKLNKGMHDSERSTKRWLVKSTSALASRRLSASIMLFSPHLTSCMHVTGRKSDYEIYFLFFFCLEEKNHFISDLVSNEIQWEIQSKGWLLANNPYSLTRPWVTLWNLIKTHFKFVGDQLLFTPWWVRKQI